jgi:hypothetical protein
MADSTERLILEVQKRPILYKFIFTIFNGRHDLYVKRYDPRNFDT